MPCLKSSSRMRSARDDFARPKVVWKRVGSILRFYFDTLNLFCLDSTCFATGKNIEFACCVLNSPMGRFLLKDAPKTGTGDLLISVQAVTPIRIPEVTEEQNKEFKHMLEQMEIEPSQDVLNKIDNSIFNLYGLSEKECDYISHNFA